MPDESERSAITRAICCDILGISTTAYYLKESVALTAEQEAHLRTITTFSEWERTADGRLVVRLATSWATLKEDVDKVIESI